MQKLTQSWRDLKLVSYFYQCLTDIFSFHSLAPPQDLKWNRPEGRKGFNNFFFICIGIALCVWPLGSNSSHLLYLHMNTHIKTWSLIFLAVFTYLLVHQLPLIGIRDSSLRGIILKKIKHVLLAVAQSRSLHVVHEVYLCKSCFRNAIYQHFKMQFF